MSHSYASNVLLFLVLSMDIPCCVSTTSVPDPTPVSSPHFRLHILDQDWGRADFGYTRDSAWPALKGMDWEDSVWVITEDDIEFYSWSGQTITLTLEATTKLRNTFDDDVLFEWETLKQAFVVTYNGEWLYGGVFSHVGSAAGIQFPVICMDRYEKERIALHLRPGNMCGWTPSEAEMAESQHVFQIPEVYALFVEQGKLVER